MNFAVVAPELKGLAPILLILAAACLGVLVEAFAPPKWRRDAQLTLMIVSVLASLVYLVANWRAGRVGLFAMQALSIDGPTYTAWGALLVFGLLAMLVFGERKANGGVTAFAASAATTPGSVAEARANAARQEHTEVFPLGLFALAGMMIFCASNDLLILFVSLEVFSLPLYLLSGMARRRRLLSQESAMKYFLLGAFSSAFFLMGIALTYGYAGSFQLSMIDLTIALPSQGRGLLYLGMGLMAVGLLFKIGVVPFHNWTPDVYMGAPTPVTGFMAICTKLAAAMALLRVFFVALGGERWSWQPVFMTLAILTMLVGAVFGLTQSDIKRLLAYSSIAHAGFILTAVTGAVAVPGGGQIGSVGGILFYLVAYGFATIGAFAIVTLVRRAGGEANDIAAWEGLGRRKPLLAGVFALFLLSFAGIPLTAGFVGKWAVFEAAWRGGFKWLVVVAVAASLVAAFFYIRVIVAMFFTAPADGVEVADASVLTWIPIGVGAIATVVLGVMPGLVLDLPSILGSFLR